MGNLAMTFCVQVTKLAYFHAKTVTAQKGCGSLKQIKTRTLLKLLKKGLKRNNCKHTSKNNLHFSLLASVMEVEVHQYVQNDVIVMHKQCSCITPNGVVSMTEYKGAWAWLLQAETGRRASKYCKHFLLFCK